LHVWDNTKAQKTGRGHPQSEQTIPEPQKLPAVLGAAAG
jgi:hypothetical protein